MKSHTAVLDASGYLLLPETIRKEAGLNPGMVLEIRCRAGRVEIEPPSPEVKIVENQGVYVATPVETLNSLSAEVVRATQERIRDRHSGS